MKIFTGKVISKHMQKTAVVVVERMVSHPSYKKRIRLFKKYHVHDEIGSEVGQRVKFVEGKPISKTKKWKVIGILDKNFSKNRESNLEKFSRNKSKKSKRKVQKVKK